MGSRILIAEDDPSIALALKDDLELEGYAVEVVGDGLEAVERVRRAVPDLLILDLMLPGKSGYDVCRDIRLHDRDLPILMLSARSQEAEKVLGLEMGADDYVTKPFSPLELRARVKTLLRRRPSGRHRQIGPVIVDLERFTASADERDLELTPIELRLLVTLGGVDGRACTRSALLDEVWGSDVVVTDRTVDTHVSSLRAKLSGTAIRIESVRGVGYRLVT